MRISRLLPLAIVALLAGQAVSSSSPQGGPLLETDRVPNKDRAQMYPRWTRGFVGFSNNTIVAREMAVQEDGTVHLLLTGSNGVYYSNNRPEGRTRNGFSTPFLLKQGTLSLTTLLGDIAVRRDGTVTAVYGVVKENGPGNVWVDIHARQFNPATQTWSADTAVTQGSVVENFIDVVEKTTTSYAAPSLVYDLQDNLHMVYSESIHYQKFSPEPARSQVTSSVKYSLNLAPGETVKTGTTPSVTPGTEDPTGLPVWQFGSGFESRHVLSIGATSTGTPHVMWMQHESPTDIAPHHGVKQTGWLDTQVSSAFPFAVDLAVDSLDRVHLLFSATDGRPAYGLRKTDGTFDPTEVLPGNVQSNLRIAVDARNRPVVVMTDGARTSYASKLDNPAVLTTGGWVVQEGLDHFGFGDDNVGINDIAVSPGNEFVHVIYDFGAYTRSTEFNSGVQDGFTMVPFGPGTVANVATGNLRFELPLFSARTGFGFGTSFSLLYNSLDGERGTISPGWSTSFDMYVVDSPTNDGTMHLHLGEGRVYRYEALDFFGPTTADEFGNFSTLERTDLGGGVFEYKLTLKSGIRYIFENSGRLTRIEDLNTNTMQFTYVNGLLDTIMDSHGRQTKLEYDPSKRLKKVTDPGMQTYTLTYEAPSGTNPPVGKLEKVTFDGAPSGQTVAWRFEYYTATNFERTAVPPVEEHKGLLAKIFTPRGNIENYFYQFGYKPDGRVISVTEPEEMSVENDTASGAPLPTTNVKARRDIFYIDPVEPFDAPHVDEGTTGTRISPAAILKDRRGFETRIEFQYMRCLADRVHDALPQNLGGPGRLRRFFDTQEIQESSMAPPITVPRFRNLKRFLDKEGNETKYEYTYEDEPTQEEPKFVMDNVRRILQPPANSEDQPGPDGAAATVEVVEYKYKEDAFSRVEKVIDTFGKETEYVYETGTLNLQDIKYPSVTGQGIAMESFAYGPQRSRGPPDGGPSPDRPAGDCGRLHLQ